MQFLAIIVFVAAASYAEAQASGQGAGLQGIQCVTSTSTTGPATTTTVAGRIKIFKFNDYNEDGVWQKNEPGLGGFPFSITGPETSLTVVTDRFGEAYASGLSAGTYTITEDVISGWKATTKNPQTVKIDSSDLQEAMFGNRQTPDSNPTTTTSSTTLGTCTQCRDGTACGETNGKGEQCVCSSICADASGDCTWVCGLRTPPTTTIPLPGKLIIYKWNDHSGDGVWDAEEPTIGGFSFTVTGPVTRTLITNDQGQAYADNLPVGAYTITENLPTGWMITTDNPQIVIIQSGQTREVRFGDKQVPATTTTYPGTSTTIPVTCSKCADGTICGADNKQGQRCICSGICISYPDSCEFTCELGNKPTTTTTSAKTTTTRKKTYNTEQCCGFHEPANKPGDPISACTDGKTDYGETDVDCGGSCAPCVNGNACVKNADCKSKSCHDRKCTQTYCTDGLKNVDETDVDCGGTCTPCEDNRRCRQDSDCMNEDCVSGVCGGTAPTTTIYRIPRCFNGLQDTGEVDVDCGGECNLCLDDKKCSSDSDCQSKYCVSGVCRMPTCSDGVQNQGETAVDCGGPCTPCTTKGGADYIKQFTSGLNSFLMVAVVIMLVFLLYMVGRKGDDEKKDRMAVEKATIHRNAK